MSSKTARVTDEDPSTYTFSLRIKHPSVDPDEIRQALGISPDHAWGCGEPRRSEGGLALGGTRRNSYWSATLKLPSLRELVEEWIKVRDVPSPKAPTIKIPTMTLSMSSHLALQLVRLRKHKALLERLTGEGGEVSLLIEMTAASGAVFTIEPTLARQMAEMGLRIEFQLE